MTFAFKLRELDSAEIDTEEMEKQDWWLGGLYVTFTRTSFKKIIERRLKGANEWTIEDHKPVAQSSLFFDQFFQFGRKEQLINVFQFTYSYLQEELRETLKR